MDMSSGHGEYDQHPISLAYLPPTPRQTRLALAGGVVLLLGLAVSLPLAAKPLPRVNGFIPAFDAIISVTDLITAGLLLAQFSITRSRALRALACGYLFSAAIVVAHGLTFPGAFSPIRKLRREISTLISEFICCGILAFPWPYSPTCGSGIKAARRRARTRQQRSRLPLAARAYSLLVSCIAWLALLPPVDPVAGQVAHCYHNVDLRCCAFRVVGFPALGT